MLIKEIADMLRQEAREHDDMAGLYTQEAIVMRETAAKLEELQRRKEKKDVCANENHWI